MSNPITNVWLSAKSFCMRSVDYCLSYPARKAAERRALDEEIRAVGKECGIPDTVLTPKERRELRRDYRKINKAEAKELERASDLALEEAFDNAIARIRATRAQRRQNRNSKNVRTCEISS